MGEQRRSQLAKETEQEQRLTIQDVGPAFFCVSVQVRQVEYSVRRTPATLLPQEQQKKIECEPGSLQRQMETRVLQRNTRSHGCDVTNIRRSVKVADAACECTGGRCTAAGERHRRIP